jgi:hypothetical protein
MNHATTTAKEIEMTISEKNQTIIDRNRIEIERQLQDIEWEISNIRQRFANDGLNKILGEPESRMTHSANNLMVKVMELHSRISANAGMFNAINNQVGA